MTELISYIVDSNKKEFFFYENNREGNTAMKEKETELAERDGYEELMGIKIPPYPHQLKRLKSYHGTVWLVYKTLDSGCILYSIHGRWKEAKLSKTEGYKVKKFIITPYKEYMERYLDIDELMAEEIRE